ncbi:Gmad2 immunoglobulin-like domain-containing protein [Nocardioides sp. zg-1228]|uniref:Gmad2 immunoglobulin-like domain-containing protein n=1 Tax=Nocardioides sp. zg-1228 TaxID=2763008 RepID=UPI00164248E2|nr:Gmad2 immunoglobulin-like domain-containing protein [Nocardioides sp. zg-1228]MBC2934181.1 GerMN domain-containing protein [Nocardioides sp. zg-1228]QSF58926.1 GerMN domain-containing protein [Nocardioides sp. zg-1228]
MTSPGPVRRWVGAAAVVVASTLSLAACSADPAPVSGEASQPTATDDAQPSSPGSPTGSPTSSRSPSGSSGSPSAPSAAGTAVPVYFAGDGPGGRTVLFREFHRVQGDPLTEAARLVAGGGQPADPDYRTLWPGVEISSVRATDGVLLVEVPADGFTDRPDGMSRRDARLALQQLVYTLQGVQQERVPVVVRRPDAEPLLFGLRTDRELTAANALRTLNLVSITSPAEGDTVTGDTLTVTGVANSFEASGPCRLLQGGTEIALEGYQAEAWMDKRLFPFEVDLPLGDVSGEVVVQCETDDPTGGTEGPGPAVDTKTITVT